MGRCRVHDHSSGSGHHSADGYIYSASGKRYGCESDGAGSRELQRGEERKYTFHRIHPKEGGNISIIFPLFTNKTTRARGQIRVVLMVQRWHLRLESPARSPDKG